MTTLPVEHPYSREVKVVVPLVQQVAQTIREIYDSQDANTYTKGDGSPVTDADLIADRLIRERLETAFPNDGLLTEESEDDPARVDCDRCWIADPIDGTAQFVARTGLFDVFLALTVEGESVLAVTAHPPSGRLLLAIRDHGAWHIDQNGSFSPFKIAPASVPPRLATSRYYAQREFASEIEQIAARLGVAAVTPMDIGYTARAFLPEWRTYDGFLGFWKKDGNSAVREWDLAASDLITTEAGGAFTDMYGNRYHYNTPVPRPRAGLLVSSSPELHDRLLEVIVPLLPASPPPVPAAP